MSISDFRREIERLLSTPTNRRRLTDELVKVVEIAMKDERDKCERDHAVRVNKLVSEAR